MTAKPSVFPSVGRLLVYGVLALATAFFLLPLYAMLVTSFKDAEEIRSTLSGVKDRAGLGSGRVVVAAGHQVAGDDAVFREGEQVAAVGPQARHQACALEVGPLLEQLDRGADVALPFPLQAKARHAEVPAGQNGADRQREQQRKAAADLCRKAGQAERWAHDPVSRRSRTRRA